MMHLLMNCKSFRLVDIRLSGRGHLAINVHSKGDQVWSVHQSARKALLWTLPLGYGIPVTTTERDFPLKSIR